MKKETGALVAALDEASGAFGDTRTQLCRLTIGEPTGTRCALEGTVLDRATLTAVTTTLADRFPALEFDSSGVRLLRQEPPRWLTVATNRAGFHREPRRTSERMSEVLNGEQVEWLLEEDGWAFTRQPDGYLGWVQRAYLSPAEAPAVTHLLVEPVALLRDSPREDAKVVTRLLAGTRVAVTRSSEPWACVAPTGLLSGWLPRGHLRPLAGLPDDREGRRRLLVADATRLIGVPYLWGGVTPLGLDCSGFVRLLYRQIGLDLPRDADMQFASGKVLEPPFQPGDLLFFGRNRERAVTHVALSLGAWRIVHSSGPNNGVYEDDVDRVPWLADAFRGARAFLAAD